ncbi:MAG: hypothetical protein C0403_06070 [Desulfobacterium sp.]|nr:hypothetical protein [Desulfobacterium sp.]
MTDNIETKQFKSLPVWKYSAGIIFVWSFIMLALLLWNYNNEKAATYEAAKIQARTAFEKDVLLRQWNADHGGLYAPITEKTQPNPYLDIPEREISTPSGIKLTKITPAFMTRQIHELALQMSGVRGHITSLKPIRPGNAPDQWESNALASFNKGIKEISSVEKMNGENYMRLMRPLLTDESCLKCHAKQGYRVGDIRGGISVSVPLSPYSEIEKSGIMTLFIINGIIWFAGVMGIGAGMFFLDHQVHHRLKAEEALRHKEKLQGIIEMSGAVCHELNQPLQAISGNAELLLMSIKKDDPAYKKIINIQHQADRMGKITKKLMGITSYKTKAYLNETIIDIDKAAK